MAEQLDLTTPITQPTRTAYSVASLALDWGNEVIRVGLLGSDTVPIQIEWRGAQATTLMIALNKANLSTISLQKRILQQAVTDGKLPAGAVTGVPA